MRAWYVVKVKPRQERQVLAVLGHREIEVYFPQVKSRKKRADPSAVEPLFPGYLFARLDALSPEWVVARAAPGVSYFLGTDRVPTPVPDVLVDEIRRRVARESRAPSAPRYRAGQKVRIVEGPFEGLDAVFDGTLSPTGRSRVLVMIVGRLASVQIDIDKLASAE